MTVKETPSNCRFRKCHYNSIAPPEKPDHSPAQECFACEGNKLKKSPPKASVHVGYGKTGPGTDYYTWERGRLAGADIKATDGKDIAVG